MTDIKGTKASGEKVEAELVFLGKEDVPVEAIVKETNGKIIAGGSFSETALMKASALEVAGVVTTKASDELFGKIEQGKNWEIGEACCLKLPLLIIDEDSLSQLPAYQGRKVVLDPQEKKLSL